ncbi:uncharacterized protein HMPREF1541_01727 [Cyphellophora europaea CBS 101466]|uniref:Heterokaryon incompatibility domain-containing protein n=1 Tax=Cyphellophora europaea (strain CBS 101466) TaxID=1220924 RepID=W2S1W3_CYPE1|nr:uncharacterized protein HMPREF1541_01727 [Cyphellophora europaea CBS 101466]ETN42570.1 hypothetical protein HMPREF1541_01727 [Cyphellophora europaea CBS 101466]
MRFINTTTLQFEEVADSELGKEFQGNKYAILSHRWAAATDEVSYADIAEARNFYDKPGYAKLRGFCDLAASLGYRYGWDDTCCINKRDLNELSEAINSMYRWYQASDLCIVYLEDVGPDRKSMMDSAWFDRGWTLQELIGPERAGFYDCRWAHLGMKTDLLHELSTKTGVPEDVLSNTVSPASCSVAQRMSWAAKRTTTRIEDRAYSLLGIFGVNMGQIYGEREKAFRRLQQAIVLQGKDESIFAWSMSNEQRTAGLYAPSPESFAGCGDTISTRGSKGFSENNGEVSISLKTFPHSMETYYALLNCTRKPCPDSKVAIVVSRTSTETEDEYIRINGSYAGGTLLLGNSDQDSLHIRPIRVPIDPTTEQPLDRYYGFWLRNIAPPGHDDCQVRILSKGGNQSEADRVHIGPKDWGSAGVVYIEPKVKTEGQLQSEKAKGWSRVRWLKLGFDEDFNPMLLLANNHGPKKSAPTQFRRDEDLFDQACAWGPTSKPHQEIFDNQWLSCTAGVPSKSYGWSRGISILQVDKKKGMSGTLNALNLRIDIKLVSDISPSSMSSRSSSEGARKIWAVDITCDMSGTDPEQALKDKEKADDCDECIACCCSNNWSADTLDPVGDRMKLEARQPKLITNSDLTRHP